MNLTKSINRNSVFFLLLFFIFALWAFWPTYFSNPFREMAVSVHIHGFLMTVWCLLLIGQALLIRFNQRSLHRAIGKSSYVLVPLIIISGISAVHFSVTKLADYPPDNYYVEFGHMFNALIVFGILYGLAMRFRKDSSTHARYMICTIFPAFTPVFSRIIFNNYDYVMGWLPALNEIPWVQIIGFALADIILLSLCIIDLKKRRRWHGFPIAFIIILIYHLGDFVLYRFEWFRSFVDYMMSLPLS